MDFGSIDDNANTGATKTGKEIDFGYFETCMAPYQAIQMGTERIASFCPGWKELFAALPLAFVTSFRGDNTQMPSMNIALLIGGYYSDVNQKDTREGLVETEKAVDSALRGTTLEKFCKWDIHLCPKYAARLRWFDLLHPRVQQYTQVMIHYLGQLAISLQTRLAELTRHERPLWSKYERFYDDEKEGACLVCNTGESVVDDTMILCDGCERIYHTTKCTALQGNVPKGDWYCSSCRKGGAKANQSDADIIAKTISNSVDAKTGEMSSALYDLICTWIPEFELINNLRFRGLFSRFVPVNNRHVYFGSVSHTDVESLDNTMYTDVFDALSRLHERYAKVDDDIDTVDKRHDSKIEIDKDSDDTTTHDSDEDLEDAGFVSGTAPPLKEADNDDDDDDDDEDYVERDEDSD
jgi:hypothetical protein